MRSVDALGKLRALKVLWIEENRVKDLSGLVGCTNLQVLHCYGNKGISGLLALKGLPRLKELPVYPNENEIKVFFGQPSETQGHKPAAFGKERERLSEGHSDVCEALFAATQRDHDAARMKAAISRGNAWVQAYRKLEAGCNAIQRQSFYVARNLRNADFDVVQSYLDKVQARLARKQP